MRIGFDAKRYFHNKTGLGNYSRDLVRILSDYYPENIYSLYNPKPAKETLATSNSNSIQEILPISPWFKKMKGLWRSFGINKQIQNDKIAIFHGLSGEIPFGLPKTIKKVVTIHDLIFLRFPHLYNFWDRKIHTLKFKYATKKSDCIIAISEQTKNDIITFFNVNPDKVVVIYQGCNSIFKETFSTDEIETVKEKFGLPNKFLLNVGTLEKRKNALNIVKGTLQTKYPLVLIGKKTAYYQEIEKYILENKMANVMHLECSQKELAIIYQLATIFIYPSVFEGFGIPIIEALFSKTPVITNKEGVFPEAAGPDSIYVNVDDSNEIQLAIDNLWDNETKRVDISEKGYRFIQKFNDKDIANTVMNLYKTII